MAKERLVRRSRTLLSTAAITLAVLAAPSGAAAVLAPLPVVDLFTSDRIEDVTVAASPRGDAIVGWTGQNNGPTVRAAFRPGKGPFAPVESLTNNPNGERPGFVFEPDGTVLAVWSHATTGEPGRYATRGPGGVFSASTALPIGERFADVGIDAAGTALVVWKSFVAGGDDLVVASRRPAGGVFTVPPVPLSTPIDDNFIIPRVAVNGPGEAVAAWSRSAGADASVVEARIGTVAGPAFGNLLPLASESAADTSLSQPAVAIAPSGEAIAVWSRSNGASSALEYAVRPPGSASFGTPETLTPDGFGPRVAFDAAGTAIVAFIQGPQDARVPSAIVRPAGGPPGPVLPLAPAGLNAQLASVGFDASGAGLVAWRRSLDAQTNAAEAARRPAGGPFAPAVRIASLGATGRSLAVAVEPDGDAVAAWRVDVGPGAITLQVGGLDNLPDPALVPVLGSGPAPAGTARCQGVAATIVARGPTTRGTARRDVIVGRPGPDRILALGGNDLVCGLGGRDLLLGGAGADRLVGGPGRDRLLGGPGRDRLLGGPGIDLLRGGLGRDLLVGGPGRDRQIP